LLIAVKLSYNQAMIKAYVNGKLVLQAEANISIFDRGFLYGDGAFESLRTYNKKPFLIDDHLKRLFNTLKLLHIKPDLNQKELKTAVIKTVSANNFKESYIKIIVTRGAAKTHGLGLKNFKGKANTIIIVEPQPETKIKPWTAIISTITKSENPTSYIKSLCYLDNMLAKVEAEQHGADEAFMLDERGNLTEGSVSNIFLIKFNTVFTPPEESPILMGITRKQVIKLAKQAGLRMVEKYLTPKDLYNAEECFCTLSGQGIVPVTKIWKKKVGDGKVGHVTQALMNRYEVETKLA